MGRDTIPVGHDVDEMRVSPLPDMPLSVLVDGLGQGIVHFQGIGIIAPEIEQFPAVVAGEGIGGRDGNPPGRRQGEDPAESAVLPAAPLSHVNLHPGQGVSGHPIVEQAHVGHRPVPVVEEAEMRIVRHRLPRRRERTGGSDGHPDVIILAHPLQEGLRKPSLDGERGIVQHGKGCQDGIRGDLGLNLAQLHLEPDVPAHGKTVGPDLQAGLFLAETEQ